MFEDNYLDYVIYTMSFLLSRNSDSNFNWPRWDCEIIIPKCINNGRATMRLSALFDPSIPKFIPDVSLQQEHDDGKAGLRIGSWFLFMYDGRKDPNINQRINIRGNTIKGNENILIDFGLSTREINKLIEIQELCLKYEITTDDTNNELK